MKCIADLHIKDPGSALTHFIAFVGSAAAAAPLLMKAAAEPDASRLQIAALAVFIVSMIFHSDCRNLHSHLPDCAGEPVRFSFAGPGVGHRGSRNPH